MAKRFSSTEIWKEDWFLDMPNEYKLFWFYMLSNCDHAGLFKVNLRSFNNLLEVKVNEQKVLELFNHEKARIRIISLKLWLIEDFFYFQYGGIINKKNKMHVSVLEIYNKHNINLLSIRGLEQVKESCSTGQEQDTDRVKDKDKDKVKDKE